VFAIVTTRWQRLRRIGVDARVSHWKTRRGRGTTG